MRTPEVGDQRSEISGQASGVRCQAPSTALHAIHHPHSALRTPRSGVALILTLGLLTVITLAVVAFVVTMRIEHLAASNTVYRAMARQYVDLGASEAMGIVDWRLIGNNASCYPVQGWSTNSPGMPHFFEQDCFGCPSTNGDPICLFRGSATNLLPGTLAAQASQVQSGWITISETNATTGSTGIQAGRVSFLVVNLSGMMDVHALNADRQQTLGEPNSAYTLLGGATNGNYSRVFLTQPDFTAANQGQPASNLVTFSYDPGPDVFFAYTNLPALGTRAFANLLTNRFNINIATQYAGNYTSQPFLDNWLAPVSNLLADAGVAAPAPVAWNILNYLDSGRIPIVAAGALPAFRTGYGVKDVPLINKVLLEQVDAAPTYDVKVELWYPFVPNDSPNNTTVWVGIYTNSQPDVDATTPEGSDLSFQYPVPSMAYAGSNEFFVAGMSNTICFQEYDTVAKVWKPVSIGGPNNHTVWIWPRVLVDGICVDEALVMGGTVTNWLATGCAQFADPRANDTLSAAAMYLVATPGLGATNANNILVAPLVHADAPMRSAGELRHIYAPEMGFPNNQLNLSLPVGAACLDRFTVHATNSPVHGLVQANTPYTNIWRALMCDLLIGWTNSIHADTQQKLNRIVTDSAAQMQLAGAIANAVALPNPPPLVRGWTCYQEMLPLAASNLNQSLGSISTTNAQAFAELQDILAGLADRVTFRGNTFLVIVCGQRISPLGRVLADQRAAFTIVRDAFTGRWVVDHVVWLTE